jgi:hypothetical protein
LRGQILSGRKEINKKIKKQKLLTKKRISNAGFEPTLSQKFPKSSTIHQLTWTTNKTQISKRKASQQNVSKLEKQTEFHGNSFQKSIFAKNFSN